MEYGFSESKASLIFGTPHIPKEKWCLTLGQLDSLQTLGWPETLLWKQFLQCPRIKRMPRREERDFLSQSPGHQSLNYTGVPQTTLIRGTQRDKTESFMSQVGDSGIHNSFMRPQKKGNDKTLAKQSFDFLSKDWSQRLWSLSSPRYRVKHRNLRALRMVNRTSSNKTSLVTLEGASYGWSSPSTTIRGPNPWHIFQYRPDLIGKFPWELRTSHALPSARLLGQR